MAKRKQDVIQLINFLSQSKNIERDVILSFLLNSIQRIVHSQLDPDADITLEIVNDELVLTNHNKFIVADDEYEDEKQHDASVIDIKLSEARKINPDAQIGQTIASQISFDDFSRSTYSKIENSFKHEIISWDKKRIYEKYQPLIGTQVQAKLEDDLGPKGAIFVLEDGTMCFMPSKYLNKSINLDEKKYHFVTIEEVYETSKSFQVLVSNDSPNQVREILKNEVPEIANGDIQIVGIARVKGERSKISFRKNPKYEGEIDVIGSIIGQNGARINRVCELFGEKIDVILYSDNIIEYIANALSPAKIISVNKKPSGNGFLVVVPDKHNTLAIGKKGINVKLTVDLIRVNIDICSYSYAKENNIPINWNGNINEEELSKIESTPTNEQYRPQRKQNHQRGGNVFLDFDEFEKELAEYNSEISLYEPIDYAEFEFNNSSNSTHKNEPISNENNQSNINNNQEEKSSFDNTADYEFSKKNINKINQNFKFDKDIAGDFDIDDYDFSGFDDEDDF